MNIDKHPIRWFCWILLLLALTCTSPAQAEMRELEMAQLSDHAYSSEGAPKGWERIHTVESHIGLSWTLFERHSVHGRVERVLAFRGTEGLKDMVTNLLQPAAPVLQYQEALVDAKRIIENTDKRANYSLVVTGHSLGGALAQYVSFHTGVPAVVFNSAPVGFASRKTFCLDCGEIDNTRSKLAQTNITNVWVEGDPVHGLHQWTIPGKQLGRQYMLPANRSMKFFTRHEIKTVTSLLSGLDDLGTPIRSHSISGARFISQKFSISRDKLVNFADTVGTLARAVKTLHDEGQLKIPNQDLKRVFVAPDDIFLDTLEHLQSLQSFQLALEKDIERAGIDGFMQLQSHTREEIARFGLQTMPALIEVLERQGLVRKGFAVPTLGVENVVAAAASHAGRGYATNDTVTSYIDGVNSAAWGGLGLAVSGGNLKVASAFQSLGSLAANAGRVTTASTFEKIYDRHNGIDDALVENWRTAQQSNMARGIKLQSVQQFYANDANLLEKIGNRRITESNRSFGISPPSTASVTVTRHKRSSISYREQCSRGRCWTSEHKVLSGPLRPTQGPGGVLAELKVEERETSDDTLNTAAKSAEDALKAKPDSFIVTY